MLFNKILIQELNHNQKNLVKYFEKNAKNILNMSISEIARANYVSPSFITKTLKKLGFYGWKDYRAFIFSKMIIPNSNVGYLKYLQKNLYPSIDATISNIDEFDINDWAKKIRECKGITYFVGEGFSYFIALDQSRRYKKSGVRAIAINANDYEYETFNKLDIVIIISASGHTRSVYKNIEHLKENKIDHLLITMNPLVKSKTQNVISGSVRDSESFNEREFPKNSRFIILVIFDWIFTKFNKL